MGAGDAEIGGERMKRLPNSTFAEYRKQRKEEQKKTKKKSKGTLFWDSSVKGTYRRKPAQEKKDA